MFGQQVHSLLMDASPRRLFQATPPHDYRIRQRAMRRIVSLHVRSRTTDILK
jgi:hypothetical protein